jgi:hypothetical protein
MELIVRYDVFQVYRFKDKSENEKLSNKAFRFAVAFIEEFFYKWDISIINFAIKKIF